MPHAICAHRQLFHNSLFYPVPVRAVIRRTVLLIPIILTKHLHQNSFSAVPYSALLWKSESELPASLLSCHLPVNFQPYLQSENQDPFLIHLSLLPSYILPADYFFCKQAITFCSCRLAVIKINWKSVARGFC